MKDVGKIFENRLNDGKKAPSKSVWGKINTSLEVEKLRKKRILYNWLVGGGLFGVFVLFLVFNNISLFQSKSPKDQNNIPIMNQSDISSDPASGQTDYDNGNREILENSQEDKPGVKTEMEEKSSHSVKLNENKKQNDQKESFEVNTELQPTASGKKSNNKVSPDQFEDKSFTVSENYYYYNSANGKQLVTKSKEEIDSLISN